jgi:hypothetical protein
VTLTDLELENRVRDQRSRIDELPPVATGLAQRVRERAREQRRRRVILTAAGIAAALVFVALPVVTSGVIDEGSGEETAATPSRRPSPNYVPPLGDLPTRGSLADDEEWLADVAELSWRSSAMESDVPSDVLSTLPDPPADTRQVAFAGEVPGGRVALVLGRDPHQGFVHAWFAGPIDADPRELTLAAFPTSTPERLPLALWATPDPASDDQVIVVVGHPGDQARLLTGRQVTADGKTRELWQTVPMEDGAGAARPERPFSWPFGIAFEIQRNAQAQPMFPALDFGHGMFAGIPERIDIADPRGLARAVTADELQWPAEALLSHYGLPADQLRPTLLVAGSVGAGSTTTVVLVGVTFPSGATATHLSTYWGGSEGMTSMTVMSDPVPAGTALLDQVLAIATTNSLTVSGPTTGSVAEAYRADGTLLTMVPLTDGWGVVPLAPMADLATVRVLDARGSLVAEVPVQHG